ncbi:hypothetical protein KFE25_010936 [Diacronema lutheri]|uniref:Uncharacterized protein n=1 Tax=Diacronema lutheri TaxID=2081491 RepID=A0A7R9YHM6_DIALT|nr:hypothetical protein KFE25_010936 [Diacronema lutheri]|mmetsp:Transcript_14362/g.44815  ORF Transcript_14362/g.44815 Transcript_14362/m.44815 type:complete len:125 (+) Transcript_14362:21-395(+)
MLRVFLAFVLLACASAFNVPMVKARAPSSQVQMSLGRREAAFAAFAGLAALATSAQPAEAGLPEFVRCPAPEGTCEAWKKDKKPSPTFAEMRETSPFFGKSAMLNSVPKVKGVLVQSTTFKPTN